MKTNSDTRILVIDRFRGIMIFCMIFFQYLDRFDCFGILGQVAVHYPNGGILLSDTFSLADIGAPIFFFALALNFLPSFRRHMEQGGKKEAYLHFIKRDLAITGFGACIYTIDFVFGGTMNLFLKFSLVLTALCLLCAVFSLLTNLFKALHKLAPKAKSLLLAVLQVFGAYYALYGIGSVLPLLHEADWYQAWDVLPSIGMAELIALCFASLSTVWRGVSAGVMLTLFALIHEQPGNMELIDIPPQGGVLGAFSWAAMLLFFTVYADLYYQDRTDAQSGKKSHRFLLAIAVGAVVGLTACRILPINKGSVSPAYVLISIPITTALFALIALFGERKPKFCPMLWWGESPIIMFLLQYLLVNVPISLIPGTDEWGIVPASLYAAALVSVITLIAYRLDKNRKRIRL